jgi:hypothetical protein
VLACIADVSGDAVPELLVTASYPELDRVLMLSGRDGTELRQHVGDSYASYGETLCAFGDLNGDGAADYLIGAPAYREGRGRVDVHSGRDGTLLARVEGTGPNDMFGAAVCRLADVDGDGVDDLAVGAPRYERGRIEDVQRWGSVFIFSGRIRSGG